MVGWQAIAMKRAILALAAAMWTLPATADNWVISDWPAYPRGAPGSFQTIWTQRIATDPGEGVASFFSDRLGADGERLHPEDRNPKEHLCARPDPAEIGSCLKITGPGGPITCRVADVGPDPKLKRAIDLLPAGFKAIGLKPIDGLGRVTIKRCD